MNISQTTKNQIEDGSTQDVMDMLWDVYEAIQTKQTEEQLELIPMIEEQFGVTFNYGPDGSYSICRRKQPS